MTQSPYGGSSSPGPNGPSAYQSTSTAPSGLSGAPANAAANTAANTAAGPAPGPDFGATTISNPGARPAAPPPNRSAGRNSRGPRRARLQLRHISPLTVLKFSCVLAVALFFVWLIVVGVLYGVLDAAGVIGHVNDTVIKIDGNGSKPPVTAGIVFGGAAIIGVINIVLFVALTTIGSVIYNLCADLVGGIEITLSER